MSKLYINFTNEFTNYMNYLIYCFGPWTIFDNKIKLSNKYHSDSNNINLDVFNSQLFQKYKLKNFNINEFINSNDFLIGLINSFFLYKNNSITNIDLLLNEIYNNNKNLNKLNKDLNKIIKSFYIGLSKVLNNDNRFFRHYLENGNYYDLKLNENYPPNGSFYNVDNCWPCEFGNATMKRGDIGNSILVNCDKPYHAAKICGLLELKIFDQYNGKLILGKSDNKSERDHFYADAQIPLNNWIFLLENLTINDEMCKTLDNLIEECGIIETEIIQLCLGFKELLNSKIIQLSRLK